MLILVSDFNQDFNQTIFFVKNHVICFNSLLMSDGLLYKNISTNLVNITQEGGKASSAYVKQILYLFNHPALNKR